MCVIRLIQQSCALQTSGFRLNVLIVCAETMIAHVIQLQEIGITVWTFVPFPGVATYVRLQVVALAEALGALLALVRTFARVRAHVYGQIVGTMETLAAGIAQIGLCARMISERGNQSI